MIKSFNDLIINFTFLEEEKPYFVDADTEIEFEFDADLEPWIKSIVINEAKIIDRYNDSWQFELVPDPDNSLYVDIVDKIKLHIEHNLSEDLINEWLLNLENSYLENVGE